MLKVKIKKTGEVRIVTNNVGFGLIDRGEAVAIREPQNKREVMNSGQMGKKFYKDRHMSSNDRELKSD